MKIYSFLFLLFATAAKGQELFAYTEPASNMPAHSVGLRVSNMLMREKGGGYQYRLLPEIMIGANKNLMVHLDGFLSNSGGTFKADGGGIYAKYRFYTSEDVHRHLRLAAFGRLSYNTSQIMQQDIQLVGQNSGYNAGIIATQLVNKIAISTTVSFDKALNNNKFRFPNTLPSSAFSYSLSFGKLMLPKEYTDYKQTNVNFMLEFLGQTLNENGNSYLDAAPVIQFIFNSQARLDFGFRQQIYSSIDRMGGNSFLLKIEYLMFNALRKR